ncbi:peptidoglycan-binding protein [Streptomyces hyaluromycini]|uniref:Peptidoglycan-binding protein n=1 Tax=Streptomyces hyaluromycini TaxID=1377993 RepID=A0ABV1WPT5_9ACTN
MTFAVRPRHRKGTAALGVLTAAVAATGMLITTPSPAVATTTSDVRLAQTDLNGLAYSAGAADGIPGARTKAATESFQSDRCLSVDGMIGPQTLGGLKSVVKQVQAKAKVAADGAYGSGTAGAVQRYQRAHHLSADGIAGPDTMKSMGITRVVPGCHTTSALRTKIVRIAKSQIGVTESGGKCVPGKPYSICADWCAAFATWVWRDAGIRIPFMKSVPSVYDWAVAHGKWVGTSRLSTARPGDLIIFGRAGYRYHIGVVDHVSGHTVRVISGNTANPNGSGRIGVYGKTYTLSSSVFYGLVRP